MLKFRFGVWVRINVRCRTRVTVWVKVRDRMEFFVVLHAGVQISSVLQMIGFYGWK